MVEKALKRTPRNLSLLATAIGTAYGSLQGYSDHFTPKIVQGLLFTPLNPLTATTNDLVREAGPDILNSQLSLEQRDSETEERFTLIRTLVADRLNQANIYVVMMYSRTIVPWLWTKWDALLAEIDHDPKTPVKYYSSIGDLNAGTFTTNKELNSGEN